MRRIFTRADIETHIQKNWGSRPGETLTIKRVDLLCGFSKPIWRVEFVIETSVTLYHDTLLITQRQWPLGNITLWSVESTELPQGCATVEEEQKVMRRIRREQRKEQV